LVLHTIVSMMQYEKSVTETPFALGKFF